MPAADGQPRSAGLAAGKGRIWQIISLIPQGRVTTYGTIAKLAALPNQARWVGRVLRELPKDTTLPWHRVINASGKIAMRSGSGASIQQEKLRQEGLVFCDGHINLRKYGWPE